MAYTNPVARAMQSQEALGTCGRLGSPPRPSSKAPTGSARYFHLDTALPAIGEQNNAPISWFSSPQMLADKRKARAQAEQQENEVKSLPGKAAIIKAQAITAKAQAGQNIGGTLSGTPQGGMPMMPGQTEPAEPRPPAADESYHAARPGMGAEGASASDPRPTPGDYRASGRVLHGRGVAFRRYRSPNLR